MSVTVRIPPALRSVTGGDAELEADLRPEAATVRGVLDALEARHAGLKAKILDEGGAVLRFVNVFVGEDDIRTLDGLDTALRDGDDVSIIPAIAGGR